MHENLVLFWKQIHTIELDSSYGAQESVTKPKEKKFIGLIDANDLQIEC